jgi:hypothetical protein
MFVTVDIIKQPQNSTHKLVTTMMRTDNGVVEGGPQDCGTNWIWSDLHGVPKRTDTLHRATLIPNEYATKIGPESNEIDRHHSHTQSSAIDL